jgi:MFS transporter, DHA2 family, methylenomycin A resistance protein
MRSASQPNLATADTTWGHSFPDRPSFDASSRAAWRRLAACTAAAALLQLDGTLITVALPSVAHSMRVSGASTSVVLSVYFAAYAVMLLPGGMLVDRFGARRLALVGLGLFALGAAAGALCSSIGTLAATRVVQGAGAGLVSPAALAGAVSGFAPERRGRALGVWGASAGVSNLLGPLLGGLLTVWLGWRADWWALVPLALLAASAIVVNVPRVLHDQPAEPGRVAFNAVVLAAASIAALTFAVMIGSFYIAEQYLQRAVGYSALAASSVLVLAALLVGAAAPIAGRLADRRGERLPATAGFLATGAGLLVLGLPSVSLHNAVAIVALIPVGLGLGMLFVPVSRAALNATPPAAHGRTSAVLSGGRLFGAAIGAGLGGLALSGGATPSSVHDALLLACGLCIAIGAPLCTLLPAAGPVRQTASAHGEAGLT